jgi:glucokinase
VTTTRIQGLTVGVDIGGTKIASGVVDAAGRILETVRADTPAGDVEALERVIIGQVQVLRTRHDVAAVGISAAGWISADRSTVLFAPNIAWRDEPLREVVESEVGLPAVVENDANAAAWGEYRFGAGADVDDLLLVTVGTGVGGGIIVKDQLVRGTFGIAAEIGHMRVVPGGRLCGCGRHGCWEQYASGSALVLDARELAPQTPDAKPLLDAAHGEIDRITGPMITLLAQQRDPFSVSLLANVGRWLGEGIASLTAVLDPGVVAIGGGVSEAGDLLMGPLREAFLASLPGIEHRPHLELRLATLGNDAGLIGAADLARVVV